MKEFIENEWQLLVGPLLTIVISLFYGWRVGTLFALFWLMLGATIILAVILTAAQLWEYMRVTMAFAREQAREKERSSVRTTAEECGWYLFFFSMVEGPFAVRTVYKDYREQKRGALE